MAAIRRRGDGTPLLQIERLVPTQAAIERSTILRSFFFLEALYSPSLRHLSDQHRIDAPPADRRRDSQLFTGMVASRYSTMLCDSCSNFGSPFPEIKLLLFCRGAPTTSPCTRPLNLIVPAPGSLWVPNCHGGLMFPG